MSDSTAAALERIAAIVGPCVHDLAGALDGSIMNPGKIL